jgi:hypothetical protein
MSSAPTTDPKPTTAPKTEPVKAFPDWGTLIAAMDKAREDGDEALRALYRPRYEMAKVHGEGWATHMPLLASVVATARPGPVLEIGVGRGSSPLLVEMCRAMGRDLVGIDSEQPWLDEIASVLTYPSLIHMPDWSALPAWLAEHPVWSVIFIDHGPGEARLPVLKMVHEHADVEQIVCHDVHNPGYLIGFDEYLMTKFKHYAEYVIMPSCTAVVSDVRPYGWTR